MFSSAIGYVPQGMCAPGLRSHPLSRGLHIMPFTLALALSRSLGVVILMCFLRKVAFQVFSLCPPQLVYTLACLTGARCWFVLVFTPSVNAVSECRWYEFPEDNCEDTGRRGGSLHLPADHGLHVWTERRWPWILSLVAFLAGRQWFDERLVRVVFCVTSLSLVSFFLPGVFDKCHADT